MDVYTTQLEAQLSAEQRRRWAIELAMKYLAGNLEKAEMSALRFELYANTGSFDADLKSSV